MKRLASLAGIIALISVSASQTAAALNPVSNSYTCVSKTLHSAVCSSTNPQTNPISGPNGILINATHIVALAAGSAAVIIIIISGFKFITANGDSDKAAKARQTLINAVIGLVVIIFAQAIITYTIKALLP